MANERTTHRTLRTAIALALTYLMVWGGIPVPALAEMAEGNTSVSGQTLQGERPEGVDGGTASEPAAADGPKASGEVVATGGERPESGEPEVTELVAVPEHRSVSTEDDGRSGEELFEAYVQKKFDERLGRSDRGHLLSTQSAESSLQGIDLKAFGNLKALVSEVAAGTHTSTSLSIPVSQLTSDLGPWTAQELGVPTIAENDQITQAAAEAAAAKVSFDAERVVHALLADCPYELYWYDKTVGSEYTPCEVKATGLGGEWRLECTGNAVVEMKVSAEFSATGAPGTTDVAQGVAIEGGAVSTAVERAGQIVNDNVGKTVLQRLAAYRNAICTEVAYNSAAAKGNVAYGNPWQLVWVFDGDPDTDVVCEGYAKAFKYLCDLTWPAENPDVECLLATGTMTGGTGAGRHMWNVVRMDDGRNYLVDVTNCDEGTVGEPDKLFMAHGPSGSYAEGYAFGFDEHEIYYEYDDDTKAAFDEAALTISDQAYAGPAAVTQVEAPTAVSGLTYDGSEQVGVVEGEGYALSGDFKATNAGQHTATATLQGGYEWADGTTEPKEIGWSIARKAVTVTADDKSKLVGEEDPALTATVAGTLGNDTVSYTLARAVGDEPGEYAITPAGDAEQGNYIVTFVAGKLVISLSENAIASGTWGTCRWEIDADGKLAVHPGEGASQAAREYPNYSPWSDYASQVTSVTFAQSDDARVVLPADSSHLFYGLSEVTSMDLSGCNSSGVTNMSQMFYHCSKLASLDLSSWSTSSVTNMGGMFEGCSSLSSLGVSNWNTSSVTGMGSMFSRCSSLVSLDLSGWDTSKVTDVADMFSGCSSLASLDVFGWDTSSVTYMPEMFSDCSPSTIKVGDKYAMKVAYMFPREKSGKRWRSQATGGLYTSGEVVAQRSEVADTYTQVVAVDISSATVPAISAQTYTGKALAPRPLVTHMGQVLREGTDYTLSYSNNVNPGTATVTVAGRGNYYGTKSVTFEIVARTFPDVPSGAWYAGVVSRAVGLGLLGGYANGSFGPGDKITRGQVAVVLWNMAGGPAAGTGARTFSDVNSGDYFYKAVRWASSKGVVSGYANGRFGPKDNVTREQLAVMLANYSKNVKGRPASGSASDLASMSDRAQVSSWAVPSVGWCFRSKILSGSGGKVNPKGNATRAEAAKMVVGLYDMLC